MACPCGSGRAYDDCCRPAHEGQQPSTAEALMRARYSAYTRNDAAYVLRSWHPRTRPAGIGRSMPWTGLEVIAAEAGGLFDTEGFVEFVARYRGGEMRERSRFVREEGAWLYWGPT
jgi:SEC-C motif-containing protein